MKSLSIKSENPVAVWSAQRIVTLNKCQKKYRYQYILKGGWRPDAPPELRKIHQLGLLTTENSLAGNIIHKQIRRLIAGTITGFPANVGDLAEAAASEYANLIKAGEELSLSQLRKGRVRLLRQEKGDEVKEGEIREIQQHIRSCLHAWSKLDLVKTLLCRNENIVPDLLDPSFPIFTESLGVPAYLRTDVVFGKDLQWEIVDWKTGRPSSDERQAAIYDAFIRSRLKLPREADVRVKMVHLPGGMVREFSFSQTDRDELLWQISEEYTDLQITNADPSSRRFPASPGAQCSYCPYQFVCQEGGRIIDRLAMRNAGALQGGICQ
jgi:hypothetical protein